MKGALTLLLQIALDGPAGSGKSTVARRVAKRLGCDYIDTGAMYRAIALKFIKTGLFNITMDPIKSRSSVDETVAIGSDADIEQLLNHSKLELYTDKVILDGTDITEEIRSPEVTRCVSEVAAMSVVRKHLVRMQQAQAKDRNVVMDGRDIGTVVLPDTVFKFFLTASLEERARRRCIEFEARGFNADYASILEDINQRDLTDSNRADSPLMIAKDAKEIDTTGKSIDDVVDIICRYVADRKEAHPC